MWIIPIILACLIAYCLFNVLRVKRTDTYNLKLEETARAKEYGELLADLLRIETISSVDSTDNSKFYKFHKRLEKVFPLIHKTCKKHDFDGSLLFKWKGKSDKEPVLFMNHLDVVDATGSWNYQPFKGEVIDGKLYGRGAIDDKGPLFVMLQAVEESIASGIIPNNDIYLASSCTEEIGGEGAPKTVKYLEEQGIKFKFLIDEGGMIIDKPLPMLKSTYAMIGVVEKGYGDIKFIARSAGGHASAPGKNTPLVRLGKFMKDIEDNDPFRVELTPTFREMLKRMSSELPLPYLFFTENLSLFGPLVKIALKQVPQLAAMTKTTIAFTKASGSEGFNVLPQEAYVTGNIRYIPHQANDECIAILTKIAKKYDIEIEILMNGTPAKVVNHNHEPFKLIEKTIKEVYPNIIVTPYAMTGGTDARFYDSLTDNGIRFAPLFITSEQLKGVHGLDENINISSLPKGVDFYKEIIKKV